MIKIELWGIPGVKISILPEGKEDGYGFTMTTEVLTVMLHDGKYDVTLFGVGLDGPFQHFKVCKDILFTNRLTQGRV